MEDAPTPDPSEDPQATVRTGDAVASFLFDLIRDHLPAGVVEQMVINIEKCAREVYFVPPAHHMGQYAIQLAQRLRQCSEPEPTESP